MAWITLVGANSDIAKSAAEQFARNGYHLYLLTRDPQKLSTLTEDLKKKYRIEILVRDFKIENFDQYHYWIENLDPFPEGVIYFIGYLGDDRLEVSFAEIEKVYNLNCIYAVRLLNYFALNFISRNRGTIIAVSSVSGERGKSMHYLYNSAKSALSIYLQGLRLKLRERGIKVIDIRPGFVMTKLTEFRGIKKKLAVSPEYAGKKIYQAYKSNRGIIYIPWWWRWIMLAVKFSPENLLRVIVAK